LIEQRGQNVTAGWKNCQANLFDWPNRSGKPSKQPEKAVEVSAFVTRDAASAAPGAGPWPTTPAESVP
jgi:hypothetical protein